MSLFVLAFGICLLFMLGSRTPAIFLVFSAIVVTNFKFKKIIVNFKLLTFIFSLFTFSIFLSILRTKSITEVFSIANDEMGIKLIFGTVGAYFTYILRDAVIVNYFANNDFWYGSGFLAFFYSFIPRILLPEKPVIDNGIYVIAMTTGQNITPLMKPEDLPNYGWPESYMSGYMELGFIGLLLVIFITSMLVSFCFKKMIRSDMNVIWVFLYCTVIFRQPLYLASVDLFNLFFNIVILYFISVYIKVKFYEKYSVRKINQFKFKGKR